MNNQTFLNNYLSAFKTKRNSQKWIGSNVHLTTTGFKASSRDGQSWYDASGKPVQIGKNERVWVTTGKGSQPILQKRSGLTDTYCGVTTFLKHN